MYYILLHIMKSLLVGLCGTAIPGIILGEGAGVGHIEYYVTTYRVGLQLERCYLNK